MDPDPRKDIGVDPDLDPERGLKWIRIRPNAVDPDPKRCLNGCKSNKGLSLDSIATITIRQSDSMRQRGVHTAYIVHKSLGCFEYVLLNA